MSKKGWFSYTAYCNQGYMIAIWAKYVLELNLDLINTDDLIF